MPKYTPADVTLRVTAGSAYDRATHVEVPVNDLRRVHISSPLIDAHINVRVQNYRGLPRGSPSSSPYFGGARQAQGQWLYGIAFSFMLKRPPPAEEDDEENGDDHNSSSDSTDKNDNDKKDRNSNLNTDDKNDTITGVKAADLQWGNDFDRPVRANLPPGFNAALRIAKWLIDPGLDGDVYADRPYLFGPVLSSMNSVYIGTPPVDDAFGLDVAEGEENRGPKDDDDDSSSIRTKLGMPADPAERARWALRRDWGGRIAALDEFVWRYDTPYGVDFGNAYLDFGDFNLRLPGYALGVLSVWDGQPFRYVLRNRRTGDVYLVVAFDLLVKEELNADGTLREGARVRKGVRVREEDVLVDEEVDQEMVDEEVEEAEEKMEEEEEKRWEEEREMWEEKRGETVDDVD